MKRPPVTVKSIEPVVFTIEMAAHYLSISKRTIEEYITHGSIKTLRLPAVQSNGEFMRRVLIPKSELDALIARGAVI